MSGILRWQEKLRESESPISYGLVHAAPQPQRRMTRSASPEYLEGSTPNGVVLLFPVREFRARCAQLERELIYIQRDSRVVCDGCGREFGKRHSTFMEDGALLCSPCHGRLRATEAGQGSEEMEDSEAAAWSDVCYKDIQERTIKRAMDVLERV